MNTTLQKGQKVFYLGDLASIIGYENNPTSAWGYITEVIPATVHTPVKYKIDLGPDYINMITRFKTVPHYCFEPGIGQMFFTEEGWKAEQERQDKNTRLHNFFKAYNRQQVQNIL